MVRTPSCDENGMKKGTWTPEEDRKLVAYVTRYGCWNWRQLPKFAGLMRCGKSCRLRWMNYLRPNLKRGNYSIDEEETIIKLHRSLGNKWSAIAAQLRGRTDNEVKNHWHTHLKKRVNPNKSHHSDSSSITISSTPDHHDNDHDQDSDDNQENPPLVAPQILETSGSPQPSSSSSSDEVSTSTTDSTNSNYICATDQIFGTSDNYLVAESSLSNVINNNNNNNNNDVDINPFEAFSQFSDDFWTEPFLADNSYFSVNDSFFWTAFAGTEILSPEFDANYLFFPDANLYQDNMFE